MEVAGGQKFCSARGDPPFPSSRLTLWAVPIAATVIRDGAMSTAGALIDMAAECGGGPARKGHQAVDMPPAGPLAVSPAESQTPAARHRRHPPDVPLPLLPRHHTYLPTHPGH